MVETNPVVIFHFMKTKISKAKAICLNFYCWLLGKERLELISTYLLHLKLECILAIDHFNHNNRPRIFLGQVESSDVSQSIYEHLMDEYQNRHHWGEVTLRVRGTDDCVH